jgi:hypothetical protein
MTAKEPWDIPTRQELFGAFLDGELSEVQRQEFVSRMGEDPELAEDFQRYQQTVHLLRSAGHLPAPQDLLPSLQRSILRRQRLRLDPGPGLRFPLELLSGILVLAGVLYAYATLTPGPVDDRLTPETEQTVRITLEQPLEMAVAEELGLVVSLSVDRFRTYTFCGDSEKAKLIFRSVDPTASVQEFPTQGEVRLLILSPVGE